MIMTQMKLKVKRCSVLDVCAYPLPRWFSVFFYTINSVFNLCQLWSGNVSFSLEFTEWFYIDSMICSSYVYERLQQFSLAGDFLIPSISRHGVQLQRVGHLFVLSFLLPRLNLALITEWFTKFPLFHKRLHSIDSVVHRSWKPPIAVTETKRDNINIRKIRNN